jgi:HAD superfamily hydrolase (TIGR01549 family)
VSEPVEALLVDLGGVVIGIDFGRCFERWARSAGCSPDALADGFTFDAAYEAHERGMLETAAYWDHLRSSLSVELSDEELMEGWNDIYEGADHEVLELLVTAGTTWPLYGFTNTNPAHQSEWAHRFATELSIFETIFVSSELGHRKPEREAFEAVVEAIGVPAARTLFFDDTEENVEGALVAGLQAVHVTSADSVRIALRSASR